MNMLLSSLLSEITLNHYVLLSIALFAIGAISITMQRSIIGIVMSSEIMILSACLTFVAASAYSGSIDGQIFALFILAAAAAEVALGLMIFMIYFRAHDHVDVMDMKNGDF